MQAYIVDRDRLSDVRYQIQSASRVEQDCSFICLSSAALQALAGIR